MASLGPLVTGPVVVQVSATEPSEVQAKARHWANFLSAPINPGNNTESAFQLQISAEFVRLVDSQGRALQIDFLRDHMNYQRKGLRGKNELLAKALGAAKGTRRVLDLSAGLGIDAVYMTQLGFEVTAIERSKELYVLLSEALLQSEELQAKLTFINSEAVEYLEAQLATFEFDAIYFDPMYPHKKKTALPKQEMVVFRELIGQDQDAAEVLQRALETPAKRVVVKRPTGAETLLPGVRHSFEGKVVRYDVYMR